MASLCESLLLRCVMKEMKVFSIMPQPVDILSVNRNIFCLYKCNFKLRNLRPNILKINKDLILKNYKFM